MFNSVQSSSVDAKTMQSLFDKNNFYMLCACFPNRLITAD